MALLCVDDNMKLALFMLLIGVAIVLGCMMYHIFFRPEWTDVTMLRKSWPIYLLAVVWFYGGVIRWRSVE